MYRFKSKYEALLWAAETAQGTVVCLLDGWEDRVTLYPPFPGTVRWTWSYAV